MDIYVYNIGAYNIGDVGITDCITSLLWVRRFFSGDSFEVIAPANELNLRLFRAGYVIEVKGRYSGYITGVTISRDADGAEVITAVGTSLAGMLSRRILSNAAVGDTLMEVLDKNCGAAVPDLIAVRRFPCTVFDDTADAAGYVNDGVMFLPLSDYITAVSQYTGFGVLSEVMHPDGEDRYVRIYGRLGVDRSVEQSVNAPVVFSDVYDNLLTCEYFYSDTGAFTDAICHAPENYNGSNSPEIIMYSNQIRNGIDGRSGYSGYESIEQLIEIVPSLEVTITVSGPTAEQSATVDETGTWVTSVNAAKAAAIKPTDNMTAQIRLDGDYRERFDVGDVVTIYNKKWGMTVNQRIYEITEFYGSDRVAIECTLGTPQKTLSDYIKGGI